MDVVPPIPFVVGQWVRGDRFYGRHEQIADILEGPRGALWLLGTRRVGKTSLLRQLEHLAVESPERGYVPLYWDFQGAQDPEELHLGFRDSLLDSQEYLQERGIELAEVEADDLFVSLGQLRRRLRSRGLRLLLLCDEVEELIGLVRKDASLLRKLRRTMQSGEELRVVLASTIRLWALTEERQATSPFLHGFTPPLYLPTLSDGDAGSLLRQEKLPSEWRPQIEAQMVSEICSRCDNHPYLLQLVGKRLLETGDLEEATEQVATDEMVSHFFSVDFEMLSNGERQILRALAEESPTSSNALQERLALDSSSLAGGLLRLESLGLIRRAPERSYALANAFFRRWIRRSDAGKGSSPREPLPGLVERVTSMLDDLSRTDEKPKVSPPELLALVYDELRQLAGRYMSRERRNHTLQPTALVHEAYLRLVDQTQVSWQGRTHFLAVAAKSMRRILIDHARGRGRVKRGGDWMRVTLLDHDLASPHRDLGSEELLDLDRALEELGRISQRQVRIVELRYFAGLNVAEVASVLGVSKRTVESDWAQARAWLERELSRKDRA